MIDDPSGLAFDIAVSFAGEDRALVESVVERLEAAGLRVFYDDRFKADFWGEDLVDYFTDVYMRKSRFALIFISRHYADKLWTNLERRTVLARALEQQTAYVLPVRLDDTQLKGLLPTVGYLDARVEGVHGIVANVLSKLGGDAAITQSKLGVSKVPRTATELERLFLDRPDLWEYFTFAGLLVQGKEHLNERFLDYEMGFSSSRGSLHGSDAYEFLRTYPDKLLALSENFNAILSSRAQEAAFGAPSEPGDPARINHLAQRLVGVYESFLDAADEIRGTQVPSVLRAPRDALADALAPSIASIRAFIDQFVIDIESVPKRLAAGEAVTLQTVLTLEIDRAAMKRFSSGLSKAKRKL